RYLDAAQGRRRRFIFERPPLDALREAALPRFFDGLKLDQQVQPVIFWDSGVEAAERIRNTARLILKFRSGLSPEKGGITETIDTRESAKKYFDQYWERVGRGNVFLSFAGHGEEANLADRLAQILRFRNLRCFHYRDP